MGRRYRSKDGWNTEYVFVLAFVLLLTYKTIAQDDVDEPEEESDEKCISSKTSCGGKDEGDWTCPANEICTFENICECIDEFNAKVKKAKAKAKKAEKED